MSQREQLASRLGFLLLSAGCAIGLGNVWRFPYITGKYGGAVFLVVYLLFLIFVGLPVLIMEFSVGRATQRNMAHALKKLEPAGTWWHKFGIMSPIGNYLLMMFYTTVAGWMLYYCFRSLRGDFVGASAEAVEAAFSGMLADAPQMTFWTVLVCILGFVVCIFGLNGGVEKVSKFMMAALLLTFALMGVAMEVVVVLVLAYLAIEFYALYWRQRLEKEN